MGTILKLIKYLAIAFVVFLLISIVEGLLGAFGFIALLLFWAAFPAATASISAAVSAIISLTFKGSGTV